MRIEDRGPLGGTGALGPDAEKEREVRSKGTSGASGAVPDAVRPSYASMLEGLAAFAPTDLGTDFEARLAEIAQKMQDAKGEADMDRLSNEQETKRNQIQENRDRLGAAQGKMEGSAVADDAGRVSAIIGSVAAGLGAAAMMVVGAVVTAVPGLQVLGGAMFIGGMFMAAGAINGLVAGASDSGMGVAGNLLTAIGVEDDVAAGWDMAASITLAVGAVVSAVVGTAISGGAGAPAAVGAMLTLVNAVNAATSSVTAVATSTSGLVANALRSDAAEMRAQTQESQAVIQQIDGLMEELMDFLRTSTDQVNALLDSAMQLHRDTGDSLSRTRFAG
ncbi:hypothetical protein [Celeribacter sp.]|uniref:hypothetical protein n=1 Tax=Celeribacter sp. TaxID=1890673 RepID=UPI003A8FAE2D